MIPVGVACSCLVVSYLCVYICMFVPFGVEEIIICNVGIERSGVLLSVSGAREHQQSGTFNTYKY